MKQASININFDSFAASSRFLGGGNAISPATDPCYAAVADRFMALAQTYEFKYTIFVVGIDLHDERVRRIVRGWADAGHEIGNHSLEHIQNLGELGKEKIRQQVGESHRLIAECVGYEPKGFVSPGWSMSPELLEVLIDLGYEYDSSLFPSPVMPLVQLRLKLTAAKRRRGSIPLLRRDFWGSWLGSRQPYWATPEQPWYNASRQNRSGSILVLPLPTTWWRQPVWHTMAFALPSWFHRMAMINSINSAQAFYYLTHPNDLIHPAVDAADLPKEFRRLERVGVPFERKVTMMKEAIEVITERCQIVTMTELATSIKKGAAGQ